MGLNSACSTNISKHADCVSCVASEPGSEKVWGRGVAPTVTLHSFETARPQERARA